MKMRVLLCVAVVVVCMFPASAVVQTRPQKITNSIGMDFVLIPAGSFKMGADPNFEESSPDETPRHRVSISKAFYLAKTEVTQEQWVAIMGSNPSEYKGRQNPVENVSWNDVQEFIRRLNAKEGSNVYRLPTEAEWEYACRAGSTGTYSFGDDKGDLGTYAWFDENSGERTHPVATKRANAWGLYDMHGNVMEWVQDWYGETYYSSSPSTDPRGPASGSTRVVRGGSWDFDAGFVLAAPRIRVAPGVRYAGLGFRLARSLS